MMSFYIINKYLLECIQTKRKVLGNLSLINKLFHGLASLELLEIR
jgi:hypothetical protein